jgi:dTDP-4-dehydrorhamnose reductase
MKALLIGARGLLGADLAATAPSGLELRAMDYAELDITDPVALAQTLDTLRPDVVVNASGYTAVDRAEMEPGAAFALNSTAVGSLGHLCAEQGALVVHFSTDYVFDGRGTHPYREDDATAPLSVYGASKLAGERALLSSGVRALVIRSQWLFGQRGKSFPRTMWERAREALPTRVVNDQHGRPTFTVDLARAMWTLIERGTTGMFHAANGGHATWHDVASQVFRAAGVPELLSSCVTADYPTVARRPARSELDTRKLEGVLGQPLRPWQSALQELLECLQREDAPRAQTAR